MNFHIALPLSLFLSILFIYSQQPIINPINPIVHQQFKITLQTDRSTTYDWYFKEAVKQLSPAGNIVPKDPLFVKMYGDPTYTIKQEDRNHKTESKTFTFQALNTGTAVLRFEKKHRYKTGKKVLEAKEIKVVIKDTPASNILTHNDR